MKLTIIAVLSLLTLTACQEEQPAVPRAWIDALHLEQPLDEAGKPRPLRVDPQTLGELREKFRAYETAETTRLTAAAEARKQEAQAARDAAKAEAEHKAQFEHAEKTHLLAQAKARHDAAAAALDAQFSDEAATITYDLSTALAGLSSGSANADARYTAAVNRINADTLAALNTLHAQSQAGDANASLALASAAAAAARNDQLWNLGTQSVATALPLILGTGGLGAAALSILGLIAQSRKRQAAETDRDAYREATRQVAESLEKADDGGDLHKFITHLAENAEDAELSTLYRVAKADDLPRLAQSLRQPAVV